MKPKEMTWVIRNSLWWNYHWKTCRNVAVTLSQKAVKSASSSDSDNKWYIGQEQLHPFYRSTISSGRPNKKQKQHHYSAETIVEIEDRYGNLKPIRCLLDTSTSSTLILRDFVKKGQAKLYKGQSTSWTMMGGKFNTNRKALLEFKFTELSTDKK